MNNVAWKSLQIKIWPLHQNPIGYFLSIFQHNSIQQVCRMLKDKSVRVHEIGIEVFSPFTPMLGDRGAPDKVYVYIM